MKRINEEDIIKIQKTITGAIKFFQERKIQEINNVKYYFSEQWSVEELQERKKDERPAVTFNQIKRFVNWLFGVVKQMDVEVKAIPRSVVSENTANLVTGIIRTGLWDVRNKNAIDNATMDAFIRGVGFVWIYPDFDEDPNGFVRIKRIDPTDVYWDSLSEEPDFTDAKFVFFIERLTEDEIKERYPDAYKKLKDLNFQAWSLPEFFSLKQEDKLEFEEFLTFQQNLIENAYGKLYPIVHFRERIWIEEPALVNTKTNRFITFPTLINEEELYARAYELNQQIGENIFKVDTAKVKRWRLVDLLGNVVLDYVANPYGTHYYDIVPFFCYKIGRHYQGFVDDLIDPQDEFNWRKSLLIEILRDATIDSFWIPKGSMTDIEIENAQEKLKKRKQLIPIRYELGQPIPIQSDVINKIMAIVQLEQLLRIDIKEIGGMVDALLGIVPRKLQSGKAIQALQTWGFIPFETVFNNYYYGLYTTANLIYKIARFIYSKTDTIRITMDGSGFDFIDLNVETPLGKINQILIDDFDIALVVRARTGDELAEKFMELVQLRQLGVPVPDEFLIMFSKVPYKQALIQQMQMIKQQLIQEQRGEESNE